LARAAKKAVAEGYTVVFVDESGFYLLPMVVRTYAPMGQTPILRHLLTYDHLSVISAITPQGKLYTMTWDRSIKGPDVVRFLKHLLRHIPGKLLIIWDGATIHRSHVMKTFLANGAAERILLERLPGYAPELNPDEGIWNYLKRVELKNVACRDLSHLRDELRKAVARLRHKTDVIQACFGHALITC
jgi:transposase